MLTQFLAELIFGAGVFLGITEEQLHSQIENEIGSKVIQGLRRDIYGNEDEDGNCYTLTAKH